jgi:hypothetical protein
VANLTLLGELGRRLVIEVHGYERDEALDPYDANWLRCSAEVEQGAFRGSVKASFATGDLTRFLSELDGIMTGSRAVASFDTMEEALAFRVEVNRAGRAMVTGKLREADAPRAELSFAFETDRSFLMTAHADLKRIVSAFPERTVGD